MSELKEFLEQSPIAKRVTLPSIVIVRELTLSYPAVKGVMESDVFQPSGADSCDLEVGGQRIARGRIVRKRGEYYFKVTTMEKGEVK